MCIEGVLSHLLPHVQSDVDYFKLLEVVLSSHVAVLELQLDASPSGQADEVLSLLKAKEVTMETITNMTYSEDSKRLL